MNLRTLPEGQQRVLWYVLRERMVSFRSSDIQDFFPNKSGKEMGGLLSGLYRNEVLELISGGRDKSWKLSNELEKNLEKYRSEILEIKTYWPHSSK